MTSSLPPVGVVSDQVWGVSAQARASAERFAAVTAGMDGHDPWTKADAAATLEALLKAARTADDAALAATLAADLAPSPDEQERWTRIDIDTGQPVPGFLIDDSFTGHRVRDGRTVLFTQRQPNGDFRVFLDDGPPIDLSPGVPIQSVLR